MVTFYLYYALVLMEFGLNVTADTSAMHKTLPDERQPLLKGKKIIVEEEKVTFYFVVIRVAVAINLVIDKDIPY